MAINRRRFLAHSSALTATTSLLSLGASQVAAAGSGDYKALVCVLLAGGNDSFNMLVPNDADQHAAYQSIRADLALPQAGLLPLNGTTSEGRRYALHPGMPELQSLYNNGTAAFIANVGTLLEPVDATAVAAGAPVPVGLYSHSDQIQQWQTATPHSRAADGWGGRISELVSEVNVDNGISMNISLGGSNVFQNSRRATEYSISPVGNGAPGINAYHDNSDFGAIRRRMLDGVLAAEPPNLLRQEYRSRLRQAIDNQAAFTQAMDNGTSFLQSFSTNAFSASMRQVARVIAAREPLGVCRQTFFVLVGGWDHHDEVLNNQAQMLPWISQGLAEFHGAMSELGVGNDVTTFTISDFGRTLTSNGKGSDHGWGGHAIVSGGAVRGGQIYGAYPELSTASPLDTGRGRYVPTTASDLYFAELVLWFGVAATDLATVLPNIGRFYSPGAAPPMGFLLS